MKKNIQLTTGLCAAVLALSLATTTYAEEQTASAEAPMTELQATPSLAPLASEETVTPVTPEAPLSLSTSEETPTEAPLDPRISEIRVIHRRRTLKPDYSPVASSTDVVYKTVEARALQNMTYLEMDQQPLQTKMEKHGIEYDILSLILKMASITRALLKKELLPRPSLKSFISMTISI